MTTLAPSCSTILRISWMARSAVSSPQPTLTTSIGRPPAVAPLNPSVAVVRRVRRRTRLVDHRQRHAGLDVLVEAAERAFALGHDAEPDALAVGRSAGVRCGGVGCGRVGCGRVRCRRVRCGRVRCRGVGRRVTTGVGLGGRGSSSSSSSPQAEATRASEMKTPKIFFPLRDRCCLVIREIPLICVGATNRIFRVAVGLQSR